MQNTSHAVMSQRHEPILSDDNFPTPPWATRALLLYGIPYDNFHIQSCLEPACGDGHMAKVLQTYFNSVDAFDVNEKYGYERRNFLTSNYKNYDWVITNPPFNFAEKFIHKALTIADRGVAILARTTFLESVGRFERLFNSTPPTIFAQFVERVPMVKGRLDKNATTATGYAWFIWLKSLPNLSPKLVWIPPCRKQLERGEDYNNVERR